MDIDINLHNKAMDKMATGAFNIIAYFHEIINQKDEHHKKHISTDVAEKIKSELIDQLPGNEKKINRIIDSFVKVEK